MPNNTDSFVQMRYTIHSGELGPPDDKFLPDDDEGARYAQSATLDLAREKLNEVCRQLHTHLREIAGNLENSQALQAEYTERRTQAVSAARTMEQELAQHSRLAIVKVFKDREKAELDFQGMKDLCEHLSTQADHDKRCLAALNLALQALADATFLSESQPLGPAPSSLALSASLAPLPAVNPRGHTSVRLLDQEAWLAAREYERHALARGLDERVRYGLSDAVLQAEFCEAALKSDPVHASAVVKELKGRLNEALRETDMLIFELEPMMLSELGLAGTIQRYMQDLVSTRHAPIGVRVIGKERRLHIAIERAIFRAAHVAVQNALCHSEADRIQVALSFMEDAVILSVEDDGIGFEVDRVMERARKGFHTGLGQLRIEVDLIGAVLGVKSHPGKGTRIDYIVAQPDLAD